MKQYWELLECVEKPTLEAAVFYAKRCVILQSSLRHPHLNPTSSSPHPHLILSHHSVAAHTEVTVHPSHCVLLASKLYENTQYDLDELQDGDEDGAHFALISASVWPHFALISASIWP